MRIGALWVMLFTTDNTILNLGYSPNADHSALEANKSLCINK